ncbi:MAG: biotin/lipoyl-containing protein [Candidatus Fimivivens sp.]
MADMLAPNLGQSGMDITIETWFKAEGETIKKGEPLIEISNEKLNQEIPAPQDGVLTKILVQEGDTAAIGSVIAKID